jgi:hypothetical protein
LRLRISSMGIYLLHRPAVAVSLQATDHALGHES